MTATTSGRSIARAALLLASLGLVAAACAGAAAPARSAGGGEGGGVDEPQGGTGGTGGAVARDAAAPVAGRADTGAAGAGGTGGGEARDAAAAGGAGGGTASPDAGADTMAAAPDLGGGTAPDSAPTTNTALTAGWTQKEFTFAIHKPYDLAEGDRYRFDPATGVHTLWVLRTDKAHQPGNTTAPRTEIRMRNDYTSGNHQFEADMMVVAGTAGPSVMQVFGGQTHATAFMLKASAPNGGTVRRYDNEVLKTGVYDKWFHLNVIHEALPAGVGKVKVYIDGMHVGTFDDRNTATHYFKCGVYGPSSERAETRFRNIKYWVKP